VTGGARHVLTAYLLEHYFRAVRPPESKSNESRDTASTGMEGEGGWGHPLRAIRHGRNFVRARRAIRLGAFLHGGEQPFYRTFGSSITRPHPVESHRPNRRYNRLAVRSDIHVAYLLCYLRESLMKSDRCRDTPSMPITSATRQSRR